MTEDLVLETESSLFFSINSRSWFSYSKNPNRPSSFCDTPEKDTQA